MIDNLFEKLEKAGVDTSAFINKHKLLEVLPDIAECLILSIQRDLSTVGLVKQGIKNRINPVLAATQRYSSYFWNVICEGSEVAATQYGDLADNFLEKLLTNENLFKL
jgi:hypothetical protein